MNETIHWFWSLLVLACLVWYAVMTVVVACRGFVDIRGMLIRLKQDHGEVDDRRSDPD